MATYLPFTQEAIPSMGICIFNENRAVLHSTLTTHIHVLQHYFEHMANAGIILVRDCAVVHQCALKVFSKRTSPRKPNWP